SVNDFINGSSYSVGVPSPCEARTGRGLGRGEILELRVKLAASPRPSPPSYLWRRGSNCFPFSTKNCFIRALSVIPGLRRERELRCEGVVNDDRHPRPQFEYAGGDDPLASLYAFGCDDKV